jgi:hypothetical protein
MSEQRCTVTEGKNQLNLLSYYSLIYLTNYVTYSLVRAICRCRDSNPDGSFNPT